MSEAKQGDNIRDILLNIGGNVESLAHALSWFIKGDDSLFDELINGTFDESVAALEVAFSLISAENFYKLSVLAKNVALLAAKQK